MNSEQLLKIILDRFDKVDQRFNEVDHQFKEVLTRLDSIGESQQEDVRGTLQLISKKVDGIRVDVDYLSEDRETRYKNK
ncbi:hypothetical protein [Mesobacillus sp.]|uniref:hypothetical protein n=1 Tax=Mesobacillus sp. TaxID=2675271 RepID=UPI0039EDFD04